MKNDLKLVMINSDYCEYLRKFDERVPYNFSEKKKRPFIGVLFEVNNCKYFAPLSSPKPKHLKIKNNIDFLKLDHGKLGAINFNNMLPVMASEVVLIDLNHRDSSGLDEQYQKLLQKQIYWLNRNKKRLYQKFERLYHNYITGKLNKRVKIRCCDFKLLEEKCKMYHQIKKENEKVH